MYPNSLLAGTFSYLRELFQLFRVAFCDLSNEHDNLLETLVVLIGGQLKDAKAGLKESELLLKLLRVRFWIALDQVLQLRQVGRQGGTGGT